MSLCFGLSFELDGTSYWARLHSFDNELNENLECVFILYLQESHACTFLWKREIVNSFLLSVSSSMCLFYILFYLQFFSFLFLMITSQGVRDRQTHAELRNSSRRDTMSFFKILERLSPEGGAESFHVSSSSCQLRGGGAGFGSRGR